MSGGSDAKRKADLWRWKDQWRTCLSAGREEDASGWGEGRAASAASRMVTGTDDLRRISQVQHRRRKKSRKTRRGCDAGPHCSIRRRGLSRRRLRRCGCVVTEGMLLPWLLALESAAAHLVSGRRLSVSALE